MLLCLNLPVPVSIYKIPSSQAMKCRCYKELTLEQGVMLLLILILRIVLSGSSSFSNKYGSIQPVDVWSSPSTNASK